MFELQASMPGMGSAEYQTTIPLKFLIIISKYMKLCECLDNQPIKITTRVLSSDVAGRHKQPVDSDIAERRKWLEAIIWNSG